LFTRKLLAILQQQRARRRRRALQRLKGFREPLTQVSGLKSMSVIVAKANTVSKDLTAGQMSKEPIIHCCHAS